LTYDRCEGCPARQMEKSSPSHTPVSDGRTS
jgi:hypothetical protein